MGNVARGHGLCQAYSIQRPMNQHPTKRQAYVSSDATIMQEFNFVQSRPDLKKLFRFPYARQPSPAHVTVLSTNFLHLSFMHMLKIRSHRIQFMNKYLENKFALHIYDENA